MKSMIDDIQFCFKHYLQGTSTVCVCDSLSNEPVSVDGSLDKNIYIVL